MCTWWASKAASIYSSGRDVGSSFLHAVLLVLTFITVPLVFGPGLVAAHPESSFQLAEEEETAASTGKEDASPARALLSPSDDVTDLKFNEFFELPVGPRGLALTQKLRSLDGKRVRILGYMVKQGDPHPGVFLFAALPLQLHDHEYGLADDLPPATIFVHLSEYKDKIVPYLAGPFLLTGSLRVGNQEEVDGRISLVRLTLDTVPPAIAESIRQAALNSRPQPIPQ